MVLNISSDDAEMSPTRGTTLTLNTTSHIRMPQRVEKVGSSRARGPPTPNMTTPSADLHSPTHSSHDPPPPPTPAQSPGPDQPDWSNAGDEEDYFLSQMRKHFKARTHSERTRMLGDLLNLCTSQQLSFVRQYVDPLLKKDPFKMFPPELTMRVYPLLCYLMYQFLTTI